MNKKYWLKGLVICVVIAIIGLIVEYVLAQQGLIQESFVLIPAKPFFLLYGMLLGLISKILHLSRYALISESIIQVFGLIIVSYGVIGAIIGWAYGKMKNRNSMVSQ